MERKNTFVRALVHQEDYMDIANRLKNATDDERKAEARRLANREWYQQNKDWKQKYNYKYYRTHTDYWKARYRNAMTKLDSAKAGYHDHDFKLKTNGRNMTPEQIYYHELNREVSQNQIPYYGLKSDIARENKDRAVNDEMWFLTNYRKMPVSEAWSDGAKQIRDAGKKFIKKLENYGFYLNARQKYWDWRNGRN